MAPDRGPRQVICACWGGDARPSVSTAVLPMRSANMDHQSCIAQVPPRSDLPSPRQMLMKARDAHAQYPARCAFNQLQRVCSTTPRPRAPAATLCPDSTNRTASCLNSSVYRPRFPLLIIASLSLLNQLAKGDVLRGQGHVNICDDVAVVDFSEMPEHTVAGQIFQQRTSEVSS